MKDLSSLYIYIMRDICSPSKYTYIIFQAKLQEQKVTSDSKSSKCDELGASTKNSTIINNTNGAVNNTSSSAEDKLSKVILHCYYEIEVWTLDLST